MRIQALKNAAAILEALGDGQLTRDELREQLEATLWKAQKIELSKNSFDNLLSDLLELCWIERRVAADSSRDDKYRIGIGLAIIHKRALDAEKQDAKAIMKRLQQLTGEPE